MDDDIIEVKFTFAPMIDIEAELRSYSKVMPWLDYLVSNSDKILLKVDFCPNRYVDDVTVTFKISPQKKTFYYLTYR